MCACRLEGIQTQNSPLDLEDYILYEMESRAAFDQNHLTSDEDVYAQLAQKEKDLILAAELGKALLEKNEELSRKQDRLSEEYTTKIEALEQEKHALRRKLESIESEYDSKVIELQCDVTILRRQLEEQQQALRASEKEKSQLINELTEQNQRLTSQLKQASYSEGQLSLQLQNLREQVNVRKSSMHEHVNQLEMLRDEITMLTERKTDLERRISTLTEERDTLVSSLEESNDRIVMLEKQHKEQEQQIRIQERELEDLRQTNSQIQDRMDDIVQRTSSQSSEHSTSLFNELEMSDSRSHSHPSSIMGFHSEVDDNDIECDDIDMLTTDMTVFQEGEELFKLKQELLDVYRQLCKMCRELRNSQCIDDSPCEAEQEDFKIGHLLAVVGELKNLIEDLNKRQNLNATSYMDTNVTMQAIDAMRLELETTKHQLQVMGQQMQEQEIELRKKADEITQLTHKMTIHQAEMQAIKTERDRLHEEQANSELSKDEAVHKARKDRDDAITKKNSLEVDLARSRIDVMNVNSQLMETIQQKIELSQQLEDWQTDMHSLLDVQLKKKMVQEESVRNTQEPPSTFTRSKLFSLWR